MRFFSVSLGLSLIASHLHETLAQITIPIQRRTVPYRHTPIKKGKTSFFDSDSTSTALLNEVDYTINTTMSNYENAQYFADIEIGSKNEIFTVILDTGSDILWLPGSDCYSCSKHTFSCGKSETCSLSSNSNERQYGKGYISGYDGTEMVGMTPDFKVKYDFIYVNSGRDISNMKADGLLGLSNDDSQKNFIDLAYDAGYIKDKVFSFYLDTNKNTSQYVPVMTNGSYFAAGFIPQEHVDNVVWLPVTQGSYWSTDVIGMAVDGVMIDFNGDSDIENVLFDSGTTAILVADPVYKVVREKLVELGCYANSFFLRNEMTCPCNEKDTVDFPTITFVTRGINFTITHEEYLINNHDGKCMVVLDSTKLPFPSFGSTGMQILGDAFLRNNFVTFSKRNQSLGVEARFMNTLTPVPNNYNYWVGVVCIGLLVLCVIVMEILTNRFQPKVKYGESRSIGGSGISREDAYTNRLGN